MKTVRMPRGERELHVEVEGCIVNIKVGLHDFEGHPVTSVEVLADERGDEKWVLPDLDNRRGFNVRVQKVSG